MPLGMYGKEIVNLNVDSLWSGGPFESKVCRVVPHICRVRIADVVIGL